MDACDAAATAGVGGWQRAHLCAFGIFTPIVGGRVQ